MHELPSDLVSLFVTGQWPSGLISVGRIPEVAPFLRGFAIEFVDSEERILNGSGGVFGPLKPLTGRDDAADWRIQKLGRSSIAPVPDLPWLDVDNALPFAGGSFGDELFIVLDYRTGKSTPRVVANKLGVDGWPAFDWVELAQTFLEFWKLLDRP